MRVLSITAGAADMYCGSCLRDNALAAELIALGHEVTLLPFYTPTKAELANVSVPEVLFSGLSIYLQQQMPMFRRLPAWADCVWDAPMVVRALTRVSISTDAALLGDLTVSMLEGERGVLAKEFAKLRAWVRRQPPCDVVNLPNALLIALARPLREELGRPILCTLQGEDLFLDRLAEPYRSRAADLVRQHVEQVDMFVAVSEAYRGPMAQRLGIDTNRVVVAPLGIALDGFDGVERPEHVVFRIGYCARIAPEKGLRLLADAYRILRRRTPNVEMRLEAAGYLASGDREYLDEVRRTLAEAGLSAEFRYHGAVDRDRKIAFLASVDAFSVPATYDEPKGLSILEAMAAGTPVVQPRRGAFVEVVDATGGGLLVEPDDPAALADGLQRLWADRPMARQLGRGGAAGVRAHYSVRRSAERLIEIYAAASRRPEAACCV